MNVYCGLLSEEKTPPARHWCQTKCVPMIPASCKPVRAETPHKVRLLEDDGHLLWYPSGYSQRSMVLVAQTHRQR